MNPNKTFGPKIETTIDANVGIIGHDYLGEIPFQSTLTKNFSNVSVFRNSFNAADPNHPTIEEINKFIESNKLDLVILEANLGTPGGAVLAFDEEFFNQHSNVYFCLYSGEDLTLQVQKLSSSNVLTYLANKPTSIDLIKTIALEYVKRLPPDSLVNKKGSGQARSNSGDE